MKEVHELTGIRVDSAVAAGLPPAHDSAAVTARWYIRQTIVQMLTTQKYRNPVLET